MPVYLSGSQRQATGWGGWRVCFESTPRTPREDYPHAEREGYFPDKMKGAALNRTLPNFSKR